MAAATSCLISVCPDRSGGCKVVAAAVLTALLLAPTVLAQDAADILAEWRQVEVPGWSGLMKQDPLTDEIGALMLRAENHDINRVMLMCDVFEDGGPLEPRLSLAGFPPLNVDTIAVDFRIGREAPRSETWDVSTGTEGSSVQVPDRHLECALRAGRIVVRARESTRVFEWASGGVVFEVVRRSCMGGS